MKHAENLLTLGVVDSYLPNAFTTPSVGTEALLGHTNPFRWCWAVLLLITTMTAGGCATWNDAGSLDLAKQPGTAGSATKISTSKVLLDVEFFKVDLQGTHSKDLAEIWNWVDESVLANQERYQLFENGMRAGLVVDQQGFRNHLDSMAAKKDVVDEFLESASIASDGQSGKQQIGMRVGRRYELPIREPAPGPSVSLVRVDEETVGRTLIDPQYLFALQATELTSDSRMRLRLRPEVQHGQMRQQFVGGGRNSGLRIDQRRETWSLPSLDLNCLLGRDELFVITADQYLNRSQSNEPVEGSESCLATQMFTGLNADQRDEQLVLLIRVRELPTKTR